MYDTNRFIHAAEPCAYREAFAEDMRRCDNALGMTDAQIADYVSTKYKPGILNPFRDTSLYIKH